MKITPVWMLLASISLTIISCSPQQSQPKLTGVWQAQTNHIAFDYLVPEGELTYLDFQDDATQLAAYGFKTSVGFHSCTHAKVQVGTEVVTVKADRTFGTLERNYVYTLNGTALELRDGNGNTATFKQVPALPDEARCAKADFVGSPFELQLGVGLTATMTTDGDVLWIGTDDGYVRSFNPDTSGVGADTLLTSGQYNKLRSMQADGFWTTCNCGHDSSIKKIQMGDTTVDTIDTDADLHRELRISDAVYGPQITGGYLWLAGGLSGQLNQFRIFKVDSDAEPDTLKEQFLFDLYLNGLTFYRNKLWGLVARDAGSYVVEVNPASGVVSSYLLPELAIPDDSYVGLAGLDDKLYLLADTSSGYKIYAVQP